MSYLCLLFGNFIRLIKGQGECCVKMNKHDSILVEWMTKGSSFSGLTLCLSTDHMKGGFAELISVLTKLNTLEGPPETIVITPTAVKQCSLPFLMEREAALESAVKTMNKIRVIPSARLQHQLVDGFVDGKWSDSYFLEAMYLTEGIELDFKPMLPTSSRKTRKRNRGPGFVIDRPALSTTHEVISGGDCLPMLEPSPSVCN